MPTIQNYGRNLRFSPARVATPRTAQELVEVVRSAKSLRVAGARHSWSRGIVTDETLVSLDAMRQILELDEAAAEVEAEAGLRIEALVDALDDRGLALSNLGSIAKQSLAGAMATGTHGSGRGFRCLADQVQSLSLVDASGTTREISRSHPDFHATTVGLGAFGVVSRMKLSVVPAFQMHAVTESMPFDEVIERFDELVDAHDHFKVWWFAPNEDAIVFRHDRTDAPRDDSDLQRWFKDRFLAVITYRPVLLMQRLWRDPLVKWTNRVLAGAYAKRFERVCASHVGFKTPWPPSHQETEWAFAYEDAPALLREYRQLLLRSPHSYNFVQELRVTKADPFWLSPSHGRDSIWLSMYNIDSPGRWAEQLRSFEAFARHHRARPHWGKHATFDPAYLAAQYPKFDEFRSLIRRYDPEGKFANPWLRDIFDLPPPRE